MKIAGVILGSLILAFAATRTEQSFSENSLYKVDMSWQDADAKIVRLADFRNTPVIITMAYSTCRYSCPLVFAKLKAIRSRLPEPDAVHFVIVSLKPSEDSPDRLASFRTEHLKAGGRWHLLTGSERNTRRLSALLGINYQQNPNSGEVMHSNVIQLLDAEGEIVQSLTSLDSDVDGFSRAVMNLIEAAADSR